MVNDFLLKENHVKDVMSDVLMTSAKDRIEIQSDIY